MCASVPRVLLSKICAFTHFIFCLRRRRRQWRKVSLVIAVRIGLFFMGFAPFLFSFSLYIYYNIKFNKNKRETYSFPFIFLFFVCFFFWGTLFLQALLRKGFRVANQNGRRTHFFNKKLRDFVFIGAERSNNVSYCVRVISSRNNAIAEERSIFFCGAFCACGAEFKAKIIKFSHCTICKSFIFFV